MKHVKLSPKWREWGRQRGGGAGARDSRRASAGAWEPGRAAAGPGDRARVTAPGRPTRRPAGGALRVLSLSLPARRVGEWPHAHFLGTAGGIWALFALASAGLVVRSACFLPSPSVLKDQPGELTKISFMG